MIEIDSFEVHLIPVLTDNYIFVAVNTGSREAIVVDPAESDPVDGFLQKRSLSLKAILNTHHHGDHVGGNLQLIEKYNCRVYGFAKDAHRIPGITHRLNGNDFLEVIGLNGQVFETPGHTLGAISYYFPQIVSLFVGDTIFSMGCGRLFEGTPQQMYSSLKVLRNLPGITKIYCAHEYTETNLNFTHSLNWDNLHLVQRKKDVLENRENGIATIPTTMVSEKLCNPFLNWDNKNLRDALGMVSAHDWEVFAAVRKKRDSF